MVHIPESTKESGLNGIESLTSPIGRKAVEIESPTGCAHNHFGMQHNIICQRHLRSFDRMYPGYLERPLPLVKAQKASVQIPLLYWFNELSSEDERYIAREFHIYLSFHFGSKEIPTGCHSGMQYRPAHQDDQQLTNQSTIAVGKIRYNLNRTRISVQLRFQSHLAPVAKGSNGPHLSGRPR